MWQIASQLLVTVKCSYPSIVLQNLECLPVVPSDSELGHVVSLIHLHVLLDLTAFIVLTLNMLVLHTQNVRV